MEGLHSEPSEIVVDTTQGVCSVYVDYFSLLLVTELQNLTSFSLKIFASSRRVSWQL
jgi:hypothetical protein